MKKKALLTLILVVSLSVYGQKDKPFSAGAEIAAVDTIAEMEPFKSILFRHQGSVHGVYHFKDFTKKLRKVFRKSDVKLDFDFDLDLTTGSKSDAEAIPKKALNPDAFDLICTMDLKYLKAWDHDLYKKRKQSYVLLLELYQKNELKRRIAITVRTYWIISTQNKRISELIFGELLPPE